MSQSDSATRSPGRLVGPRSVMDFACAASVGEICAPRSRSAMRLTSAVESFASATYALTSMMTRSCRTLSGKVAGQPVTGVVV
jgi:hypothetical protein